MKRKSESLITKLDTATIEYLKELLSRTDGADILLQHLQAVDQSARRSSEGSATGASSGDEGKSGGSGSDKSDLLNQTLVERARVGDPVDYEITDSVGVYSAGIDIGRTVGKQDNHTTAYAVLREVFFDVIDGKPLQEASANLRKIVNVFGFTEMERKRIEELFENHVTALREAGLDNVKERTKELTQDLRRLHMFGNSTSVQTILQLKLADSQRFKSLIEESAPRYTDDRISQIKGTIRGYAREKTARFLSGEISHLITTANDRKFATSISSRK